MADPIKLVNLGMPPALAKEVARQIADAVKAKPEVQALTSESNAADIVAALKA